MRCLSCNKILSDREATRKYLSTAEFIDLCDNCISYIDIIYIENPELQGSYDEEEIELEKEDEN